MTLLLFGLENIEDAHGEQGVIENCFEACFVIKSIISMYPSAYAMARAVFPSFHIITMKYYDALLELTKLIEVIGLDNDIDLPDLLCIDVLLTPKLP